MVVRPPLPLPLEIGDDGGSGGGCCGGIGPPYPVAAVSGGRATVGTPPTPAGNDRRPVGLVVTCCQEGFGLIVSTPSPSDPSERFSGDCSSRSGLGRDGENGE